MELQLSERRDGGLSGGHSTLVGREEIIGWAEKEAALWQLSSLSSPRKNMTPPLSDGKRSFCFSHLSVVER